MVEEISLDRDEKVALERNRTRMRQIIRDYKEWHKRIETEDDLDNNLHLKYEGLFLRTHFKDGWSLYQNVSHAYYTQQKTTRVSRQGRQAA